MSIKFGTNNLKILLYLPRQISNFFQIVKLKISQIIKIKIKLKKKFSKNLNSIQKDSLELHKANECLKKQCFELEYEESIIDNLLEIVDFMDKIV